MDKTLSEKPMFSNRDLISLVIPLIFDALLVVAAGLVDSAMVSSVGVAAVSGVSLVDSLSLMFVVAFNAVATGGVVVTSQYLGNGNLEKAETSAKQLIYLSLIVSITLTSFLLVFHGGIIKLVYGEIEADVFQSAKTYLFWILLGYPFLAVGSCCTALMRSMRKNKLSVVLTSGYNILNVIGNAILIYGLDMGVAGAAISTSLSRVIYAVVGIIVLHNEHLPVHVSKLWKVSFDLDILKRVAIIGGGNGIESGLFQVGKLLVARLVASFGTVMIAANSIAQKINDIGWVAVGAFSTALLPIVGQCMGAGKPDEAEKNTRKMMTFATITLIAVFGSIFLFRNTLVGIYSLPEEELRPAAYYTGAVALITIISFYSRAFLPVATFRASGDTKYALFLGMATMFVCRVGIAYLLALVFNMGLMSVWIGCGCDWLSRAIINTIHLKRGKWKNKKVI